jgi:hypothetical protein
MPRTSCSFAWATHRAVRALQEHAPLRWRFKVHVRGRALVCRARTAVTPRIRCRGSRRFVRLSHPSGRASASGSTSPTCAGDARARCLIRPHVLYTGAHTYVRGIRWRVWNESTALGFGRLIELGGATYPGSKDRAKIRLRLPGRCQGHLWFRSTTITFGLGYEKRYLYRQDFTPC